MKREGAPLDSRIAWKKLRITYSIHGHTNTEELEPLPFTDSILEPQYRLIEQQGLITADSQDKKISIMNPYPHLEHWASDHISTFLSSQDHVPSWPLGNHPNFPLLGDVTHLESFYHLGPIDLTECSAPTEKINEQFQFILKAYDCWKLTSTNQKPPNDDLAKWIDIFHDLYKEIREFMEENMAGSLNYFGLSIKKPVYTNYLLESYPQEWSNMVHLVLLTRFIKAMIAGPYITPWKKTWIRGHDEFGKGSVLAKEWWVKKDYDPDLAQAWWKDGNKRIFKIFTKSELKAWFKKYGNEWVTFLQYGWIASRGGTTPVNFPEYRNQFNEITLSNDPAYSIVNQNHIAAFYKVSGKNVIHNNIYTDCLFIFMVYAQMTRELHFFNVDDYDELRKVMPKQLPWKPIEPKGNPSGYDNEPSIKKFKDQWYDTAMWQYNFIRDLLPKSMDMAPWPPEMPPREMKPPKDEFDQETFQYNLITFMYANPPPRLQKLTIPETVAKQKYDPLFEQQWAHYMEWCIENVKGVFEKNYVKPGHAFPLEPGETKKVHNTFVDLGLLEKTHSFGILKWLIAPVTITVEAFFTSDFVGWIEGTAKKLWKEIKKKLQKIYEKYKPQIWGAVATLGVVLVGATLALTFGEEKIKKLAQ